jgi:hypothetical protein
MYTVVTFTFHLLRIVDVEVLNEAYAWLHLNLQVSACLLYLYCFFHYHSFPSIFSKTTKVSCLSANIPLVPHDNYF